MASEQQDLAASDDRSVLSNSNLTHSVTSADADSTAHAAGDIQNGAPASPDTSPQDHLNYSILCRMLVELSPVAMRNIFNGIHTPMNLGATLSQPLILASLRRLKGKGILDQRQWDVLYPERKGKTTSEDYDVVLLLILLKNICHLSPPYPNGWSEAPVSGDKSIPADLARIQWLRTSLATKEPVVTDADYVQYRDQISEILSRLGCTKNKRHLEQLLLKKEREPLDEEQQDQFIKSLIQWEKKSLEVSNREAEMHHHMNKSRSNDFFSAQSSTQSKASTASAGQGGSPEKIRPRHLSAKDEHNGQNSSGSIKLNARSRTTLGIPTLVSRKHSNLSSKAALLSKDELQAHEKTVLEKFHSKMTATISSDDVVPKLIQVGLLSHEEKNRISLATRNADRMKLVLDIVQKKPGKAFDKFLDAIKYRYTSLYDQMLKAKQAPISRRKPDEVTQCSNALKSYYSAVYRTITPVPWHPDWSTTFREYLQPWEIVDLYGRCVTPEELFQPHKKSELPSRILVEGESGVGKSTLAQYLAYTWAQHEGRLPDRFRLLFHIDMKSVAGSITQAILEQCLPPGYPKTEDDLYNFLHTHQRQTLFVFDGYEDLSNVETDLWDIIHKKLFPKSAYIVTAGSAFVTPTLLRYFDTRLIMLGIKKEAQEKLLQMYDDFVQSSSDSLISTGSPTNQALQGLQPTVRSLLLNPMKAICFCALNEAKGDPEVTSLTSLMENCIVARMKLYRQQYNQAGQETTSTDHTDHIAQVVEDVAFQMITEDKAYFNLSTIQNMLNEQLSSQNIDLEDVLKLGLIQTDGDLAQDALEEIWGYFPNRLIQEHLAARSLIRMETRDILPHIQDLVSERHLGNVCAMFCGMQMSRQVGDAEEQAEEKQQEENSEEQVAETDISTPILTALCKQNKKQWRGKLVRGQNQARSSLSTESEAKISDFASSLLCLSQCKGNTEFLDDLLESYPNGLYMRTREWYTPDMLLGLTELLKGSACGGPVSYLEIRLDHFSAYHRDVLLALAEATAGSMSNIKLRWTQSDLLAEVMCSMFGEESQITSLTLADESHSTEDNISASVWSDLHTSEANMQKLKEVAFTGCKNPALVTSFVRNCPNSLTCLSLKGCKMDLIGCQELGMKVEQSATLEVLILDSVEVKRGDFLHLSRGIKLNKSLKQLSMVGFDLDLESAVGVGEALKFNSSIRCLDLSRVSLTEEMCRILIQCLAVNQGLMELKLQNMELQESSVKLIQAEKKQSLVVFGLPDKRTLRSRRKSGSSSASTVRGKIPTVGTVTLLSV